MSQISVSIGPGITSLTSTPLPARSRYIASANPHIAYFAALYADSLAIGMRPPMLDTHTIVPDFRARASSAAPRASCAPGSGS